MKDARWKNLQSVYQLILSGKNNHHSFILWGFTILLKKKNLVLVLVLWLKRPATSS